MTIRTILAGRSPDVHSVTADRSVGEAVTLLTERRIGALPVMQGDEVTGIFSERDVIHCLKAHGTAALDRPVREGMTSPAITVAPDMTVLSALSLMTRRRIRHLPVVEGGRLIGFVSIGDLVKHRIERIEAEASALREYIAS